MFSNNKEMNIQALLAQKIQRVCEDLKLNRCREEHRAEMGTYLAMENQVQRYRIRQFEDLKAPKSLISNKMKREQIILEGIRSLIGEI